MIKQSQPESHAKHGLTEDDINPTPNHVKDLTGLQQGTLTVLGFSRVYRGETHGCNRTFWVCQCDCGYTWEVSTGNLTHRKVSQCNTCGNKNFNSTTHGMTGSFMYHKWQRLKQHHGNRVCPEWRDSFEQFYADIGEQPDDKPHLYVPQEGPINAETTYWHTCLGSTKYTDSDGNPKSLATYARELGITRERVRQRINWAKERGYDPYEHLYSNYWSQDLRGERMRANTDEKYERYLQPGVTHYEFSTEEEAVGLIARLRGYVKDRGCGRLATRSLGTHLLLQYTPNDEA